MKQILLFFLFYFFLLILFAQKNCSNTAYIQAGGNGPVISANYERRIITYPSICLHIGAGIYPQYPDNSDRLTTYLTVPFGINYQFKFNKKSMLDIGFGATWTKADVKLYTIVDRRFTGYVVKDYFNFIPSLGYRRHTKKNFMLCGSITPVINNEYGVLPFVGFSFGKMF